MRFLFKIIRSSKKGQASIEYILLISVLVTMFVGIAKRIRVWLLEDAGNCTAQSKSVICALDRQFAFGGKTGQQFRYFVVRR